MDKTDDFYWEIIEKCDWHNVSKTGSFESLWIIKNFLIKSYSKDVIESTRNFIKEKCLILESKCNSDEMPVNLRLNDDELFDVCCHIIGLGKDTFDKVKHNITLIRLYKPVCVDNFSYGFETAVYELSK